MLPEVTQRSKPYYLRPNIVYAVVFIFLYASGVMFWSSLLPLVIFRFFKETLLLISFSLYFLFSFSIFLFFLNTFDLVPRKVINTYCHNDTSRAALYSGATQILNALGSFIMLPALGMLSDHFGRRPILCVTLVIVNIISLFYLYIYFFNSYNSFLLLDWSHCGLFGSVLCALANEKHLGGDAHSFCCRRFKQWFVLHIIIIYLFIYLFILYF